MVSIAEKLLRALSFNSVAPVLEIPAQRLLKRAEPAPGHCLLSRQSDSEAAHDSTKIIVQVTLAQGLLQTQHYSGHSGDGLWIVNTERAFACRVAPWFDAPNLKLILDVVLDPALGIELAAGQASAHPLADFLAHCTDHELTVQSLSAWVEAAMIAAVREHQALLPAAATPDEVTAFRQQVAQVLAMHCSARLLGLRLDRTATGVTEAQTSIDFFAKQSYRANLLELTSQLCSDISNLPVPTDPDQAALSRLLREQLDTLRDIARGSHREIDATDPAQVRADRFRRLCHPHQLEFSLHALNRDLAALQSGKLSVQRFWQRTEVVCRSLRTKSVAEQKRDDDAAAQRSRASTP